MKYCFSAFSYDTEQKKLSHNGEILEITKKNHELLLYLLEHPNQLVSRDELIDHVWHGRVVTNNTIDQCILKFRKALSQVHEDEYIESVYGQGVRFLPTIERQKTLPTTAPKHNIKVIQISLFLLALVVIAGFWILSKKDYNAIEALDKSIASQRNSQPTIPTKPAKDDWLLDGGSSYIDYLLHLYPQVNLQKIHRNKAEQDQNPSLVLDLVRKDQSKQKLKITLHQLPSPNQDINSYQADLNLIENDTTVASIQITASQLTDLFPQIATWVAQLDPSDSSQQIVDKNIFTQNESAMQNYFLGLSEQDTGNSELALKYFNVALDSDPDFKVAWYEMAVALRKQKDIKKSISVLNSIKSKDDWLTYKVAMAKGNGYVDLKDDNAANEAYELAIQIAQASNNTINLATAYSNQANLFSDMKQNELAEQRLLLALELTDMDTQPHLYGSIMNTYAKVALRLNKIPLAIKNSHAAVEAYQISGDIRYQMHAQSRLAGLLINNNELNQAEILVKEALSYAKQLSNHGAISSNRTKLAIIYQKTGRFTLAIEQWQAVLSLNTEFKLFRHNPEVYYWLMRLHLAANNPSQAEIVLDSMQQLANEHPDSDWNKELTEISLMLALYKKDTHQAQQLLDQIRSASPEKHFLIQAELAYLKGDQAQAETFYLESAEILAQQGRVTQLAQVLNQLSELYLTYKPHKIADNLARTSQLKPFIYPFQKYQSLAAQAEGNYIEALSLMEEVKLKSGEYWQYQDQLLLDSMHSQSVQVKN